MRNLFYVVLFTTICSWVSLAHADFKMINGANQNVTNEYPTNGQVVDVPAPTESAPSDEVIAEQVQSAPQSEVSEQVSQQVETPEQDDQSKKGRTIGGPPTKQVAPGVIRVERQQVPEAPASVNNSDEEIYQLQAQLDRAAAEYKKLRDENARLKERTKYFVLVSRKTVKDDKVDRQGLRTKEDLIQAFISTTVRNAASNLVLNVDNVTAVYNVHCDTQRGNRYASCSAKMDISAVDGRQPKRQTRDPKTATTMSREEALQQRAKARNL